MHASANGADSYCGRLNAAALKLLDAEAVSSNSGLGQSRNPAPVVDPEEEKEMAAFLPMLQEYLKRQSRMLGWWNFRLM